PEIQRGQYYWKKRRKERLIMDAMHRATTPQSGWRIYQKVSRGRDSLGTWSGEECCELMLGLKEAGYLKIVGCDNDCGWLYEVNR
ncbi:MAG: hypothetical protein N0C84_05945, partial [Candidatus Thiodiazotropha taylori]|nr:hypothetical protein [Candidatus Thiodiazotropha taylori]MCW4255996.1 hypothetical protein [Candidatus Thiodiazotropha taylori]